MHTCPRIQHLIGSLQPNHQRDDESTHAARGIGLYHKGESGCGAYHQSLPLNYDNRIGTLPPSSPFRLTTIFRALSYPSAWGFHTSPSSHPRLSPPFSASPECASGPVLSVVKVVLGSHAAGVALSRALRRREDLELEEG